MKRLALICCFVIFTSAAVGQQFLWTTLKDSSIKHVPIDNVTQTVLEYYDHYQFYYDGSGFSKDGFYKKFEQSQSFKNTNSSLWRNLKKKINQIDSPAVLAFKDNSGHGSSILVVCVSKENLNLIGFSNNYEHDAIWTSHAGKEKFAKWFKTLLE